MCLSQQNPYSDETPSRRADGPEQAEAATAADAEFDELLATMLDETGGPLTSDERAAARRVFSDEAAALAADLAAIAERNPDLSEDEAADIAVEAVRQVRRARRAR